ncbi:hypothetical protein H310_06896 [Aphanomyces invadans]|uniref:Gfo/Idh/MocA-like oxidoreductase N-terminal domain-containing protein n=1 Tax=Aphanomyces invadans TaxID=157072 RepID=A0A024U6V7_9STRA|nr:hypothetical protein H310_06896 [Aphanomyces invadans]ETW01338.1 hypothetical protein H310_06896 [Aphanomyces invadans]|eukprot:XP_008870336.1 hypothetical protein H310_06896 [Aphanomyces invadans]
MAGVVIVAVVGAGRMGQIRLAGLQSSPKMKVSYVIDENLEQAQTLAAQFNATGVKTLEEALRDSKVSAVWISTPTFTHLDLIRQAAKAGKAIAVEKPVAGTLADLDTAYQVCKDTSVPLFCSFQRRFDPHYVALRDAITSNSIGAVQSIQTVFRDHPCPPIEFLKSGGDPFHDLAVHDIDFVCDVLKEYPTLVLAFGTSLDPALRAVNVMDKASVWLQFPSGVVCTMDLARHASYGYDQRIEVFGRQGMLEVQNLHKTALRHSSAAGVHEDPFLHSFPQRFRDAYEIEISHFAQVVLANEVPKVTWKAARNATIVAEACRQSALHQKMMAVEYS